MSKVKCGPKNLLQNVVSKLYKPESTLQNRKDNFPVQVVDTLAYLIVYHEMADRTRKTFCFYFEEKSFNKSFIRKIAREKRIAYCLLCIMEDLDFCPRLTHEIFQRYGTKQNLCDLITSDTQLSGDVDLKQLLPIHPGREEEFANYYQKKFQHLMKCASSSSGLATKQFKREVVEQPTEDMESSTTQFARNEEPIFEIKRESSQEQYQQQNEFIQPQEQQFSEFIQSEQELTVDNQMYYSDFYSSGDNSPNFEQQITEPQVDSDMNNMVDDIFSEANDQEIEEFIQLGSEAPRRTSMEMLGENYESIMGNQGGLYFHNEDFSELCPGKDEKFLPDPVNTNMFMNSGDNSLFTSNPLMDQGQDLFIWMTTTVSRETF